MGRPVARGVLIREEHIETLKRLPNKTMDAVLGAAFRVAIGEMGALAVKDPTGILDAVVQSIAIAALKFDEKEKERMARDAEAHSESRKREKKAQCLLDGGRQEQTETDENLTKADKKRTAADKSGIVLKERRKEGKNIYTPKSPKGNLRLPPEVDVDTMLGKENGEPEDASAEDEAASEEPSEAENMVNEMESFEFLPILLQVFGETDRLSDRRVGTGDSLCERNVHIGTGMMAANSHKYPAADEILFDRYIYEKMGSCTKPCEDGQLRYQTEYILCGKESDRENLEATALRLLLIREASNCAYLFTDETRMGQIHLVAVAASLIMFNPELEKPVSNALALAWSYLESVQDVRTLMTGGKVPVAKTDSSWQTHLYELLSPLTAIKDRDSGEGIDYSAYLQGLLLLEGSTVKTQRTMNVMEMDIRRITGNSGFRMDLCMDEFSMNAAAQACGTKFLFEGSSGYN